MGLISRAVAIDRFEEEVRETAERLASGPTASYAAAKRLFNESAGGDRLDLHLDRELETLATSLDRLRESLPALSAFERQQADGALAQTRQALIALEQALFKEPPC